MQQVDRIQTIKELHYRQRWGIRRIARELGVDRKTVRRVLRGESTGCYTLEQPRTRPVADEIAPIVAGYLKAEIDAKTPRKQRLTAVRIDELLREEHKYEGSYATVQRFVKAERVRLRDSLQLAMVPLEYEPGEDAQVDFCEGYVDGPDGLTKRHFMLVSACYSTRAFAARVPAENQEALFETLMRSFQHFGGLFRYYWFDNLTLAVRQVLRSRDRELQERFKRFMAHYGFHGEFCGPSKGNEKGGVENTVPRFRRRVLSPMPYGISDSELDEVIVKWMQNDDQRTPSGRDTTAAELWQAEQSRLIPLPRHPFDAGRACTRKVSAYSLVQVGTNFYSVPVYYVHQVVTVKLYSEQVKVYEREGCIATHPRLYGRQQTSFQLEHYLPLLERKTRAFDRAAPVRAARASWPRAYEHLLRIMRHRGGEAAGTRDFIAILWLHKSHPAERVHEAVRKALLHEEPGLAIVYAYLDVCQRAADPPEPIDERTLARWPDVPVATGDAHDYQELADGEARS